LATYNSSSVTRGDPGRIGVYGATTLGVVALGNVTLTANDLITLCYIPYGSFIKSLFINFPILNPSGTTLAISLLDTLASATTYISASTKGTNFQAVTNFAMVDVLAAVTGTTYGTTARAIGATGAPVVVWTSGVLLELKVTATASAAVGAGGASIPFMVEFAPAYDMGV
jgi:hypothetical protein